MPEPVWSWPTDDPDRAVTSGSDDHIQRGGSPAIDIPSWPARNTVSPARCLMHADAQARVSLVVHNAQASNCGRQLDIWWVHDGARWEYRSCHWERLDVAVGQIIYADTVCGLMGRTGVTDGGVHQHGVLRRNGVIVRPEDYLDSTSQPQLGGDMTDDERAAFDALVNRVAELEQANERLWRYGLGTLGNVTLEDNADAPREPSNPVKLLLGRLGRNLGLYAFFQRRFPGQSNGEYWAGIETSAPVPDGKPVAWGYGALPLRLWGQNCLLESQGALVVRNVVAERVYLSPPVYRNLETGEFVSPSSWSAAGEPLDEQGRLLGGLYWNDADLGTYLTRVDGRPVLVHDGQMVDLSMHTAWR